MTESQTGATRDVQARHPGDEVPRSARWLVGVVLVGLLVPGLIGFDVWPLTGWRLFSSSRLACQERWVLEAVDETGRVAPVGLRELPLAYQHAEWPLAQLAGLLEAPIDDACPSVAPRNEHSASGALPSRRDQVCLALLDAIADVHAGTVELRLVRDRQRLVELPGGWAVTHDPEVFHTCRT